MKKSQFNYKKSAKRKTLTAMLKKINKMQFYTLPLHASKNKSQNKR